MRGPDDPQPIYDPDAPIACSLKPQDRDERVELLSSLRAALTGLERSPHGLILRLPATDEVVADVQRFATDEIRCCPFWGFEITTTGADTTLRWDGPPDASAILDQIYRYLAGDESVEAFAGLL